MGDSMKRHSGIVAIIILAAMILSVCLNVIFVFPDSDATVVTVGDFEAVFPGFEEKGFLIPADANVTSVNMKVSTKEFGTDYPEDIQLIFGDTLPYVWAYRGEGHGAFGQQEYFSKGQVRVNLSFDPDKENDTLFFYLPKNAQVNSGSIKMTGFEYDYWESWIKEVNRGDTQTWNMDPMPFVYNNRIYVFYRSYNSTETDESDGDIAYNWTTNGINWQSSSNELTKSPDTETDYPDGTYTHRAGDYHPQVISYKGDMGVFWSSASYYDDDGDVIGVPANSNNGITHGTDRDIVVQWFHSSNNSWGPYVEITKPTTNADESNYTRNPGPNPVGKDDRRVNAVEFKNKIWSIWVANNTGNTTFNRSADELDEPNWYQWSHRGDIIVSNSSDGYTWDRGKNLCQNETKPDAWFNRDYAPTLYAWNGRLYAMWMTNGRQFGTDVENRFDYDIVYRYTEDGVTWSDHIEMTPKNDTEEGENHVDFSYPDEDPRLISYFDPVASEDRLYCVWRTRNPKITNGTDYDIVIRYTTDGGNWSPIEELTDPDTNGNFDNKPELTVYNEKLYVVWRREQGVRWENNPDGDIVTRHWDGKEWSVLQEISPWDGDGTGRDDFYANSLEFGSGNNERFYTFWVTRNRGNNDWPYWPEGSDGDVVYRRMQKSDLPLDTGLDIGNDGDWELDYTLASSKLTDAAPSITVDIKSSLNQLLQNPTYLADNTWEDSYGNEMVKFMVKTYIGQPGRVRIDDLNIKYDCTLDVGDGFTKSPELGEEPFSKKVNLFIGDNQDKVDQDGNINVNFKIASAVKGKVDVHDITLDYNIKPTITILTPSATGDEVVIEKSTIGEYTISWSDEDVDDNADVSLYYYKMGQDKSSAQLIVENIKEDDNTDSYTWKFNKANVPTGQYYILGKITDGIDIVDHRSFGVLNITWKKQNVPWISIVDPKIPRDAWSFFKIRWQDYDPDDNAKIYLYYTLNFSDYDNATQIDIDENGIINNDDFIYEDDDETDGAFNWNITHISPGSRYYIAAKIDDEFNPPVYNCSLGRVVKKYLPTPDNFTVVDGVLVTGNLWSTHDITPELSWRMSEFTQGGLNYHLTIWSGSTNAGTKIFETNVDEKSITGSVITAVVSTQLEFGKTYYAEVYAYTSVGAQSEPVALQINCKNNPPPEPSIVIKPPTPSSLDSLTIEVLSDNVDDDGDTVEFSYRWYKKGVHQPSYDNLLNINPTDTTKGDVWKVEVIPNDGFTNGPVASATIEIPNSNPIPTIELPKSEFEYNAKKKYTFRGTYDDKDGDSLVRVAWFLNLDDPNDYMSLTGNSIKDVTGEGADVEAALEFEYEFSKKGSYNVTLVIFDSDSIIAMDPSHTTVTIEVGGKDSKTEDGDYSFIIGAGVGIVIIIIMLVLLMIMLKRRKPVTEREKMYGKDQGLKPGEAYPVEESDDSYFGDKLDRKGVSSLETAPATTSEKLETPDKLDAMPEKPDQPQLPPAETPTETPVEKPEDKK
jgi:hypothetical protein